MRLDCFSHSITMVAFTMVCLLPPATKLQKGNILTHVCQSYRSQGEGCVCLSACWAETLWTNIPQADTPMQTPPGRHSQADTPWADTPPGRNYPGQTPIPWADTPQADTTLTDTLGRHPPGQTHPLCSACWDMVNKRAVCILLECTLVFLNI